MHGVCKTYRMGAQSVPVLHGVDLAVGRGEYVGIMGPSGSGKSTLLNIIGLMDTLDQGSYILDGSDVSCLSDNQLARRRNAKIGFVFQTFNLFPQLTVQGNIEVPMVYAGRKASERRERARQLAERVGLGHRLHHRPRELSGGEMQRTAIARALANDAPLICADEPTGNLDERTGMGIMALFEELVSAGRTIVLVTHDPSYQTHVTRMLRMHDGELVT